MRLGHLTIIACCLLLFGCQLVDQEEQEIQEMLKTFVTAIGSDDEDLGRACMMDADAFSVLNPDVATRVDADSYTATVLAELIQTFRDLALSFKGRTVKYKSFEIGTPWYQYKGKQAFKDSKLIIESDGEEITIPIRGIVRVENKWRIVDLSTINWLE